MVLKHIYFSKPYLSCAEMDMVADMLGLRLSTIDQWFSKEQYINKGTLKVQSPKVLLGKMLQLQCIVITLKKQGHLAFSIILIKLCTTFYSYIFLFKNNLN